jgi:hypothetical protein
VNDELESVWKEATVVQFKVQSGIFEGALGKGEQSLGHPVSGLEFEPETSRTRRRTAAYSTVMFIDVRS